MAAKGSLSAVLSGRRPRWPRGVKGERPPGRRPRWLRGVQGERPPGRRTRWLRGEQREQQSGGPRGERQRQLPSKLLWVAIMLLVAFGTWQLGGTVFGGTRPLWRAPEGSVTWTAEAKSYHDPIKVRIGTPRQSGYRIGDIIAVHIVVVAHPDVRVDLTQLEEGTFVIDGDRSEFEMAAKPRISRFQQGGNNVWEIVLSIRTWSVKDSADFTADIEYVVQDEEGNWVRSQLTTPKLTIFTTRSASADDSFDLGNRAPVAVPRAPLARTSIFVGAWLLAAMLVWFSIKLAPRLRREKVLSPNQRAWRAFDAVFAEADAHGWTVDHYITIAAHLRKFMGVEAITFPELGDVLAEHPESKVAIRVLRLLDETLYAQRTMSKTERAQLETDLAWLVPKPGAQPE